MTDACRASRVALLEGDAPHAAHVAQCPECQRLAQAIADVDAERIEALDAYVARPLSPPRPANWRVPMAIVLVLAAVALASPLLPSSAPPAPTVEATSEGAAAVVALVESTALLRWNALTDLPPPPAPRRCPCVPPRPPAAPPRAAPAPGSPAAG